MHFGDAIAWFSSQSMWRQIFIGLWLVFIAFPIATLVVMQFIETLRSSRDSTRNYGERRDDDKES